MVEEARTGVHGRREPSHVVRDHPNSCVGNGVIKLCTKCGLPKTAYAPQPDGTYLYRCNPCRRVAALTPKQIERQRANDRQWRKKMREAHGEQWEKYRERQRNREYERYQTDVDFRERKRRSVAEAKKRQMADPEKRARILEQKRESFHRRMADPVYAARVRELRQARYKERVADERNREHLRRLKNESKRRCAAKKRAVLMPIREFKQEASEVMKAFLGWKA